MIAVRPATFLCAISAAALVAGCSTVERRPPSTASVTVEEQPVSAAWKGVATVADESRIIRLDLAWQQALSEAKAKHSSDIASEGALLTPKAALPRPQPTPGSYNCRMVSIGNPDKKAAVFTKFKPFFCYVLSDDAGVLTIVKQTGSQRPAGRLWEDDDPTRMIFLGSLALGDEKEPLAYGEDQNRNMAGVFERIAPFTWRLVIPWPQSGADLEVFELTPVADQPE